MRLLLLPIDIFRFWYLEAPLSLLRYFLNLNKSFFNFFSLPLMLRTFFRPWKNEYREGLVGFSIFMGMIFKTLFIISDLIIFAFLLTFEVLSFALFLVWPVLTIYILFIKL